MTFLMEDAERESLQAALSFMDDFEASTSSLSSELRTTHDRGLKAATEEEELLSYAGELDIIEIESLIDEGHQSGDVHLMTSQVVPEQPAQYRHVKKARAKTKKKEKALAIENGEKKEKKKKKKKAVTWDPNKARNERKAEIIYLHRQVSDLQNQLDDIEKKKPRICSQSHSSSSSQNKWEIVSTTSLMAATPRAEEELTESSVWKSIADRQHNMRVKSERENIRLKMVLENQLRIAKSLQEILNKKTIKKDIERCTDGKLLSHMYPPTADRSDAAAFEELLAGVEQSYADIDAVFEANGLAENEMRSDAKMRSNDLNDIYLEVFAGKVLPFDLETTGTAVWRHFVQAKERKRYRFYSTDTSQTQDVTDDTLMENFNMILHANRTSAVFKVKQILRRYIEEDRVIIVWWAFIDPIELSDEPLSGVRFLEKGYILIKKPSSIVSGDDFSLLQTCYITTPLFTGEWTQDDHPQVGAITDFVLSTTKFNISATHQMIEDVLLQQAMNTTNNTSRRQHRPSFVESHLRKRQSRKYSTVHAQRRTRLHARTDPSHHVTSGALAATKDTPARSLLINQSIACTRSSKQQLALNTVGLSVNRNLISSHIRRLTRIEDTTCPQIAIVMMGSQNDAEYSDELLAAIGFVDEFQFASQTSELQDAVDVRDIGDDDHGVLHDEVLVSGLQNLSAVVAPVQDADALALVSLGELSSEEIDELSSVMAESSSTTAVHSRKAVDNRQHLQYREQQTIASDQTPQVKKKKKLPWDPNKARNARREELVYLRKQVADLETQLAEIQAKQPPHSTCTTLIAGRRPQPTRAVSARVPGQRGQPPQQGPGARAWEEVAKNQLAMRTKVERENIRLKLVLVSQLKIARSLEKHLGRATSTQVSSTRSAPNLGGSLIGTLMVNHSCVVICVVSSQEIQRCFAVNQIREMHPPLSQSDSENTIFNELLAGTDQSYAEVDAVFEGNGLTNSETSRLNTQMRSKSSGTFCLEVFATKVLPFEYHATVNTVWDHFVFAKERIPTRHYYNKSPKVFLRPTSSYIKVGCSSILCAYYYYFEVVYLWLTVVDVLPLYGNHQNFHLELHVKSMSANFGAKQVIRRFDELDRVVIVWRSFIDPIVFCDEPLEGVRFLEKGYVVIKKPKTISDAFTLLQPCYVITPLFSEKYEEGNHPNAGAMADFVLLVTAANIRATNQMIEDSLLQQAMMMNSRRNICGGGGNSDNGGSFSVGEHFAC